MPRDPKAYLWDVQESIKAILEFTAGLDAESYAQNPLVQAAVERKFEIIGEALNQLSRVAPELAGKIPHLAQIIAFRNQLIHGYAVISHGTVWNIIQDALPELQKDIGNLLQVSPHQKDSGPTATG